ncbi:MAG: precorrin-6A reductase [Ruminococcaceae bacterium]|jgi:precorrin-6Y C5,15-methyltransferase (decarboxylating)|nr:precorrin-6A reductase [Oscillospiraceae bacterium]
MSERICLFAGTTEGRRLAEILGGAASRCGEALSVTVCVATEYGEILLDGIPGIEISAGRMDAGEMAALFRKEGFSRILDATHPYAELVTENIRTAADECGIPVLRILRDCDRGDGSAYVHVPSVEAARDYLMKREGTVFLTTGSKELSSYIGLDMERVWARVLPTPSSLASCQAAGIPTAHIIAAQGPFSEEINLAELKRTGAAYLVTKASGKNGGFDEKIRAARAAGAVPVVIGAPAEENGLSLDEAIAELEQQLALPVPLSASGRRVTVIGIGPGGSSLLTAEAKEALRDCDAVIGAKSVADSLDPDLTLTGRKPVFFEFLPEKIRAALASHPSVRRAAVVMRGDTGFYSGTKKLLDALEGDGFEVTVLPGISSVSLFAARLGVSWDDAALVSLHGRRGNLVGTVDRNRKVFCLAGGENTPAALCERLSAFGLGSVRVAVGERLSYPEGQERITRGTAEEIARSGMEFDPLSLLYIENDHAARRMRIGIPDGEFIRGDTPMTKSEVRAVSLSALALPADAVVYDVGAGTGSVSVECALAAPDGVVYAVEKEPDAAELIRQNRVKFRAENIEVVEGFAPDALRDLPAPTHAFIGGSSGNLTEIVALLLEKNPDVRIVLNAVTVETQAEAAETAKKFGFAVYETVSVSIARSKKMGRYHMMTAQNPVTVVTLAGGASQ